MTTNEAYNSPPTRLQEVEARVMNEAFDTMQDLTGSPESTQIEEWYFDKTFLPYVQMRKTTEVAKRHAEGFELSKDELKFLYKCENYDYSLSSFDRSVIDPRTVKLWDERDVTADFAKMYNLQTTDQLFTIEPDFAYLEEIKRPFVDDGRVDKMNQHDPMIRSFGDTIEYIVDGLNGLHDNELPEVFDESIAWGLLHVAIRKGCKYYEGYSSLLPDHPTGMPNAWVRTPTYENRYINCLMKNLPRIQVSSSFLSENLTHYWAWAAAFDDMYLRGEDYPTQD